MPLFVPAVPAPPQIVLTGEVVPPSVGEDVQQGADATAAALGVEWGTVTAVLGAFLAGGAITFVLFLAVRAALFRKPGLRAAAAKVSTPVVVFVGLLFSRVALTVMAQGQSWYGWASFLVLVAVAASAAWAALRIVGTVEDGILGRYHQPGVNDRRARKIRTQTILLRRVLNAVIVAVALSAVLLTIPEVRSLGAGLLASAGLISVVAGLAVQSTLTNVFAGFQLAFTDSIRVGDVVDMQGVFGTVEEITLSNVVVKVWDGRRMVYPSSFFTSQPFENWTRTGAAVSGVVMMDVDWRVPMDALRDRLTELLESTELWDGKENAMQVIDAVGGMVRIRAVVSARNSGDLWDLRCLVREDLVGFLRAEYPEGIYTQRFVEPPMGHAAVPDAGPAPSAPSAPGGGDPAASGAGVVPGGSARGGKEPPPRTWPLPIIPVDPGAEAGAGTRPRTGSVPLARAGGNASLYTGSITAVQRNQEMAGPGEEAYAERRARQAERERQETGEQERIDAVASGQGSHDIRRRPDGEYAELSPSEEGDGPGDGGGDGDSGGR
ncbi:mechanosensitive ion channel family protein [Micrococcus sp.]|uniref:mechanosensitive ion channel family protein n=1 Tax=Micrococcus sp. TaxID=1271 RepID=UPI002A908883|nr:mechanosensitive ion channel domain-containing protein [Micrococcus sp.]MDY6054869.1 mechanosensitive ion channel [Micrococcus sp.]